MFRATFSQAEKKSKYSARLSVGGNLMVTMEIRGLGLARVPDNWEAVIAVHQHWLREQVLRFVRCPETADDVFQEVWIEATQAADSSDSVGDVKAWLSGLLRNRLRMRYRSDSRRRGRESCYGMDATRRLAETQWSPLEWLLSKERDEVTWNAIGKLKDDDIQLLTKKYVDHQTYDAIAAELGISRHAVANRLRTARQNLRDAISRLTESE